MMNSPEDTPIGEGSAAPDAPARPQGRPPGRLPAISRRTVLRVAVGGAATLAAAEICGSSLWALYPVRANSFGGPMQVGLKSDFPAALPEQCVLDKAGVFYRAEARAYIVHLGAATTFLLSGDALANALWTEDFRQDGDGSYWLALYQACPHMGTTVKFLISCRSLKCPSHGAHFHCDGEYLDGPGPRSMDRFPVSFDGNAVTVDTGRLNSSVGRPDPGTRLLAPPEGFCSY